MTELEVLKSKLQELETNQSKVQQQLDKLYKEKLSIMCEVLKLKDDIELLQLTEMGIENDNWFLSVDGSYSIFNLIKIIDVDKQSIKYLEYNYQDDSDGNLFFNVKTDTMRKKQFINYIQSYHHRKISNEDAQKLIQIGLECKEDKLPDRYSIFI